MQIDGDEILVQSPYLECIRNNETYEVRMEIYSKDSEAEKLGDQVQGIEFQAPSAVLQEMGIIVCDG